MYEYSLMIVVLSRDWYEINAGRKYPTEKYLSRMRLEENGKSEHENPCINENQAVTKWKILCQTNALRKMQTLT